MKKEILDTLNIIELETNRQKVIDALEYLHSIEKEFCSKYPNAFECFNDSQKMCDIENNEYYLFSSSATWLTFVLMNFNNILHEKKG